jgi:hypothetical protein
MTFFLTLSLPDYAFKIKELGKGAIVAFLRIGRVTRKFKHPSLNIYGGTNEAELQ